MTLGLVEDHPVKLDPITFHLQVQVVEDALFKVLLGRPLFDVVSSSEVGRSGGVHELHVQDPATDYRKPSSVNDCVLPTCPTSIPTTHPHFRHPTSTAESSDKTAHLASLYMLSAMKGHIPHVSPSPKLTSAFVSLSSPTIPTLSSPSRASRVPTSTIPNSRFLAASNSIPLQFLNLLDESCAPPFYSSCVVGCHSTPRYSPSFPTVPEKIYLEEYYQEASPTSRHASLPTPRYASEVNTFLSAFIVKLSSPPARRALSSSFF